MRQICSAPLPQFFAPLIRPKALLAGKKALCPAVFGAFSVVHPKAAYLQCEGAYFFPTDSSSQEEGAHFCREPVLKQKAGALFRCEAVFEREAAAHFLPTVSFSEKEGAHFK